MKNILKILVVATVFGAAIASASPEIAESLKAIRAVGPEGQGNVAASTGWKKLAEGNVASLLPIFEAMDGANDYALNWMRAAVDAMADRELKAGGKLPLAELGKFLLETRHNPKARRLAFELIAKVDATTTDKLLAGMLNDPSLEIRRDAVQKVIGQANQFLESSNRTGAVLLYQQALNSSRDVKQIETITMKLKDLEIFAGHEPVAMPQTLALAEVAAAALMLPGEQIRAVLGQHRHREVGAVAAIHEDDVARSQMGHECPEQRLFAAAFAPTRSGCPAQHRPGR